ncbi:MAG: MMPL family transporter, partial [Flavobacteriales bacterium]
EKINLVQTVLPTILFVVGISDLVHFVTKYIDELRKGKEKMKAIKIAFKEVGMATFLTTFTTAVGFSTLIFSSVLPIQDFGIYAAIGVFIALFLTYLILPAIMILTPIPKIVNAKWNWLGKYFLPGSLMWTFRKGKLNNWIFAGIAILALYGISMIKVDNHLLEDLRKDDPVKKDFRYFGKEFAGSRPFEMAILLHNHDKEIMDREVLKNIDKVADYLKDEYGVGSLYSPASLVKQANVAYNGGNEEYWKLPVKKQRFEQILKELEKYSELSNINSFVNKKEKRGRISGKMPDIGSAAIAKQDIKLNEFLKNNTPSYIEFKLTGTARLIDRQYDEGFSYCFYGDRDNYGITFQKHQSYSCHSCSEHFTFSSGCGYNGVYRH